METEEPTEMQPRTLKPASRDRRPLRALRTLGAAHGTRSGSGLDLPFVKSREKWKLSYSFGCRPPDAPGKPAPLGPRHPSGPALSPFL